MDEIDAIGGRRFSEGTSADREIQRTLMELLNQLDGFDQLGKVFFPCHNLIQRCYLKLTNKETSLRTHAHACIRDCAIHDIIGRLIML